MLVELSRMSKPVRLILAVLILIALFICFAAWSGARETFPMFDGQQALSLVQKQLEFGPRHPGSPGHARLIAWITAELDRHGWPADLLSGQYQNNSIQNIRGGDPECSTPLILGAHFDTREFADQESDPVMRLKPVPGANDGASGVAVLLEIARALPRDQRHCVWLVFFDWEDQGDIKGQDWIQGSSYFASQLTVLPQKVVIVDMVGDVDLNIHPERNSDPGITREIWAQAAALGYAEVFPSDPRFSMLDDHTPFLRLGIPTVDLIDFDYPQWHTLADDIDHVSADSLEAVGNTLLAWLLAQQ